MKFTVIFSPTNPDIFDTVIVAILIIVVGVALTVIFTLLLPALPL